MLISRPVQEMDAQAAFDKNAQVWEAYTAAPLGRLRQELALRHVMQSLPSSTSALCVLDAGGGTGGYAIPLAQLGHQVHLLDFSPRMLAIAERKAEQIDPALLERMQFWCVAVEEIMHQALPEHFDVIICHTLLEYVPNPHSILLSLIDALRPGGLVSVLFANPCADAMRWAITEMDLEKARLALQATMSRADLFGLPRCGLPADEVRECMLQAGAQLVAEYGVRIFADYMPAERLADDEFFARLLALEEAAGTLYPYRLFARYCQMLGRRMPCGEPTRGYSTADDT